MAGRSSLARDCEERLMRILYLYCHPLPDSFHAGIRAAALNALKTKGHSIDLLDLYAEAFPAVLTADERRHYFEAPRNQVGLEGYVARLKSAEALVVQFPAWCFGPPAMLKGFFDRILIPGVAYDPLSSKPTLHNIRKIVGVVTYGQPWTAAFWMGDAPRKTVTRFLHWFTARKANTAFHALYHVDGSSDSQRGEFIARVEKAMQAM
jgi:NAD(P)H dehydrogenase (quinone)